MQDVIQRERHPSPGPRPQPLAFHGDTLWVGCWDTSHLYAIDPSTWSVLDEVAAPGKPFGMTLFDGALRVVIADDEDDRYFYRFVPGQGFDVESLTACPDMTGSHLASDGTMLYLLQMSNQRILTLDAGGAVQREIALPTRCAGIGFGTDGFHMISADDEFDVLHFATLDLDAAKPEVVQVASLPPEARALAFHRNTWWTSHRETNEIASFTEK